MDPRAFVGDPDGRGITHGLADPSAQVDLSVEDVVVLVPVHTVREGESPEPDNCRPTRSRTAGTPIAGPSVSSRRHPQNRGTRTRLDPWKDGRHLTATRSRVSGSLPPQACPPDCRRITDGQRRVAGERPCSKRCTACTCVGRRRRRRVRPASRMVELVIGHLHLRSGDRRCDRGDEQLAQPHSTEPQPVGRRQPSVPGDGHRPEHGLRRSAVGDDHHDDPRRWRALRRQPSDRVGNPERHVGRVPGAVGVCARVPVRHRHCLVEQHGRRHLPRRRTPS